jgi:hypothetical protein
MTNNGELNVALKMLYHLDAYCRLKVELNAVVSQNDGRHQERSRR